MLKLRSTKLMCLLIAFVWTTVIIGSSYAYFIDSVTVTGNVVATGNLKAAMSWKNPGETTWKDASEGAIFNHQRWEPGYTDMKYIKVDNTGSLAFQYELNVFPAELLTGRANLLEVIDVYYGEGVTNVTRANYAEKLTRVGTLMELLTNAHGAAYGILLPEEGKGGNNAELPAGVKASTGSVEACMVLHMQEEAGNEYMGLSVGDGFKVQLYATQYVYENDSFGNTYDQEAELPVLNIPTSMIIEVTPVNGLVPYDVWFNDPANGVSATVPAGAKMADGATSLKLVVEAKNKSEANVSLTREEELFAYNVKVEGLASDNTVPVVINMGEVLPNGLNLGNYSLYHVEDGNTVLMTLVDSAADLNAHNEFTYDPVNGAVAVAMATFSEVALVADTTKAWEGKFDYSWYTNAVALAEGEADYIIANADQLAAFSAIVGGMNGQTQDSFKEKTVKLVADVNLGDAEKGNNPDIIFYPIGYNSDDGKYEKTSVAVTTGFYSFSGTFDGNGHTIGNIYQNTWEMKGDNNYYDAELQYYRDGMGLFGKVYGGTVKNLTVDHFSSDGEYTTTGVIAAYADGATFENIAITNCNPRVYNTGNGGIVGCVGWYAKDAGLKTNFTNITVDNSNKISALWGSWDVACGGLVGQYYPTSGQTSAGTPANGGVHFENCHVSAQIDVYNDVCANYQYYAYRYAGMMIGSIRENKTEDGLVYPKMDGITAANCTVNFGDWNDYYYCELVDNTTASYTHDYQMSRLVEIKAIDGTTITYLDGTTGSVPASGRANFVIVDYTKGHGTENASCYHFKDGAVWTHDMGGIQTGIDENGDGQDDLKEDKQHIYLEFNQLFTGYGWGVTSRGIGNYDGITTEGINLGNQQESVEKFVSIVEGYTTYTTGTVVNIGDLFAVKSDVKEELIRGEKVQAFVSPVDETSNVSATYTRGSTSWKDGTLEFHGKGAATITITDYYFCTPTTINVTITERQPEKKFDVVMNNGDFLHRVGNIGTVALDKLFKAKYGVTVGTVSVTVESVDGTGASGTYSNNAIQFNGTGVVKVTIKDDDTYCTPTVLYLEVVDAVNATSATSATENNVVLLNDCSASSFTVSDGHAFYGNGFKVTFAGDGSYRSAAVSYGFVTVENGGILDNVQVICNIFPESYLYTTDMKAGSDGRYPYGYSAVVVSGNSTISNCYVYGARNNIQVGEGNVTIENTVTECGSLSNIHIKSNESYTVTLDDVTTIQYQTTSKYDTSKKVLGFGILVGTNESESNPKIKLTGDLKQYNWVTSNDTSVSNTYAKTAIEGALKDSAYQHTIDSATTVNMGIVYLNTKVASIDEDERSNKSEAPYALNNITISGQTGQVYSIKKGSSATPVRLTSKYPYVATSNRPVLPTIGYAEVNASSIKIVSEFDGVAWVSKLSVDLDKISGGSYNFKFSNLTVQKYDGAKLDFTVKDSSGNTVDKEKDITLNQLQSAEYTLVVTDNRIYEANGNLSEEQITAEIPFILSATKTSIEPPKFTNKGTATAIRLVETAGKDWRPAYEVLTGVSVTYWSASESKVKTVDLSTLYKSGTISSNVWTYTCDDYTLTITGGQVHSDGTKITPVVSNNTLYFASTNKAFTTGTTTRSIILTYVFTDKNASTTWNRTETVTYSKLSEYDFSKFKNGTLEAPSSGGGSCLAEGTMITLADGNKRAVEDLRKGDMVMVYDHLTGNLTTNKVIIVVKTGGEFYKNTFVFDDGSKLVTINEHGIYDLNLDRYVNIDHLNANDYIGHDYVAIDTTGRISTKKLAAVESEYISGYKYDIVSENTLNYVAEDTLSVTHVLVDVINTFEFDDNMCYDQAKMEADIQKYGLYSYDEWQEYADISVFEEYNIPVMKVGISKGMYTKDYIISLINTFVLDDNVQIID